MSRRVDESTSRLGLYLQDSRPNLPLHSTARRIAPRRLDDWTTGRLVAAVLAFFAYACTTAAPPVPREAEVIRGVASWYGEEFAGRTTANGEIFDPARLTAAHRTLPFGTLLEIANPKTNQSVRVRVNDRGPYIGNRVIDLSYAAAQQIGLIEPGLGEVEIRVLKIGSGEREPPAPFAVTIAEAPKTAPIPAAGDPPAVEIPLPDAVEPSVVDEVPVVVDRVVVEQQRGGVITRRQVAADGTTIEEVPIGSGEAAPSAERYDAQRLESRRAEATPRQSTPRFVVQVGAFAVEANANALQQRLTAIGHRAYVDRGELYRVRIGPFATRGEAVAARSALEASGMSATIVSE